LFWVIWNL